MKTILTISAAAAAFMMVTGCQCPMKKMCCKGDQISFVKETMNVKPALFADLGETFSVPDGLAIDANNNIVLAVPNYLSYDQHGAKIVTFDKNGKIVNVFKDLPEHPKFGKVHPMGIGFGPDGNLYVADNLCFSTSEAESRILRVNYKDGKPVDCEVVVEGTYVSNAIRWQGNDLYLTDSILQNLSDDGSMSGVFKFSLEELTSGKVVKADQKKHLITTYQGEAGGFGADGMDFDVDGNMYVSMFSGGQVYKTTFNADRSVKGTELLINSPAFECGDGLMVDKADEKIYFTNSKMNSIWVYDMNANTMQRLWENMNSDGADGSLDQPCEPLVYGDELIVVNFDYSFPQLMNRESDNVNTISQFKIK